MTPSKECAISKFHFPPFIFLFFAINFPTMISFSIHYFIQRTHRHVVMLDSSDDNSDDSLLQTISNHRNVCPCIAPRKNNIATASNGSTATTSDGRSTVAASRSIAASNGRFAAAASGSTVASNNGRSAATASNVGHNNWITWVRRNIDGLFATDGPLESYTPIRFVVFQCYLRAAWQPIC